MPSLKSKDGTIIGYDKIGSGPALILVDGALCYRASNGGGPLAALLADSFTVFTFDRRGRGESSDTKPYAVAREVEDIAALIEAAGGSAMVYGISSGAALGLEAANAGLNIPRLVLYEAPFFVDGEHPPISLDYVAKMHALIAAEQRSGAVRHFMRKGVGLPAWMVMTIQLLPAWAKLKAVAPTLAYDTALTAPHQTDKPLPKGTWATAVMPTLVIGGGKSDAWMQNAQRAIAANLGNGSHQTLAGQNHMVSPAAVAPLIRSFLS